MKTLLKKNLLILKRAYILTLIEILSPIIVMLILLLMNSKFETESKKITEEDYRDNCTSFTKNNYNFCQYKGFLYNCPNNSLIALVGENFPNEIKEKIMEYTKESKRINRYQNVIYYKFIEELMDYIESKDYKNKKPICFGISYQKIKYNTFKKYIIKLHYFASQYIKDRNHANIPSSNVDNFDPFRIKPDFDSYYLYMRSGYLMTQKILYDYILQIETGNSGATIRFNILPQKYDEKLFKLLNQYLNEIISIFVLIAYAFPLSINVYRLIKEKETKIKIIMKIMGLNEFDYFCSYFVIYFIINIFYALFNSIIMNNILNYIELSHLFLYFFLFGLVIYSLIFFFQSFLEKSRISIIFCLLVYLIMYFISYPLRSKEVQKGVKIFFGLLFPPINLDLGSITFSQFQRNFNQFKGRTTMEFKNYSVLDMYILFISSFILYMFLGFYLQNVIPNEYGKSKHWYFLCEKKFWKNNNKKSINDLLLNQQNNKNNNNININNTINMIKLPKEKFNLNFLNNNYPSEQERIKNDYNHKETIRIQEVENEMDILHIKKIKKNFGEKEVLKEVTFDLYKDQIFVLLGHNGAGKTTLINILTGLINCNSGEVIYNYKNILSPENSSYLLKHIGICPQQDILIDDLTVEEHLELFYEFKSEIRINMKEEIDNILEIVGLKEKREIKAGTLSGGEKRKLSVGLALVGKSFLIVLDEPTSGMDITSRRNLWDILKKCSTGKFIILTTHFMDEASVLGNRIGILSEGEMKVIGTPLELIEKYTQSVNLNITKLSGVNDDNIIDYIYNKFKTKNIDIDFENFNSEILFRISTSKNQIKWSDFFNELDRDRVGLGIKNYSISKSTLEDVFINLGKILNKKNFDESKVMLHSQKLNELKTGSLLYNEDNIEKDINYCSKFFKDFKISFMKRIKQIYREKKTFILEILCPIMLTFIGCLVGYIEFLEENKSFPLKLNQLTNDSHVIYYKNILDTYNPELFYRINNYIYNKKFSEDVSNVQFEIIDNGHNTGIIEGVYDLDIKRKYYDNNKKNYIYYIPVSINAINHDYIFNIIVDITQRQAIPISVNFLLNNLIRVATNEDIEIEMINEPFPYTYEEKQEKKNRNQFLIVFFISAAFSLIPSNFITILIKERENNSKHLQIISGISLFGYWFNNYFFELIKYYFIGGICLLLLLAFDFYEEYLYILYLEYGPAMISFTYLFSIIFKTEYKGQITVLLLNLIFGTIFSIVEIIMRIYDKLENFAINLSYILRIIPSFCFCYGYNQLLRKKDINELDNNSKYNRDLIFTEEEINDNIISSLNVGADFIYLGVEIIIYLLLLIIFENCSNKNFFGEKIDSNSNELRQQNNEINLEESHMEFMNNNYEIKVKNLVKIYSSGCGNKINAVRNISFNLEKGEIFGFLGTNGAGKTTTFKCLSHEIYPSYGTIEINGLNIINNFDKIRNLIGYCPQFDAIFDFLTVYENLEFYGELKGAKIDKLNSIINALIEEMNLIEFKNTISVNLSGGTFNWDGS